jgi:uncharacterized protein DUF6754
MSQAPVPERPRETSFPWWPVAIGVILLLAVVAYQFGPGYFKQSDYWKTFVTGRAVVLLFTLLILGAILHARRGGTLFIRRIPGLTAIDETVGRATEMGRPITFSLGLGGLDIITLQALAIALHVVRMAIRFGTRVILTMADSTLYAVADEAVNEAYTAAGRPESFRREDVRFLSDRQFTYAAAMVGTIYREQAASNYMFGTFYAESLILAEAGNQVGAIQVAGTPSTTQIPFFVAACDYTIIGDEYYAATAYLTREPVLSGSLVGQDRAKMLLLGFIVLAILGVTIATLLGGAGAKEWIKAFSDLFVNAK